MSSVMSILLLCALSMASVNAVYVPPVNLPGYLLWGLQDDIGHDSIGKTCNSTIPDCANICDSHANCVGFTFVSIGPRSICCYPKTVMPDKLTPFRPGDVGVTYKRKPPGPPRPPSPPSPPAMPTSPPPSYPSPPLMPLLSLPPPSLPPPPPLLPPSPSPEPPPSPPPPPPLHPPSPSPEPPPSPPPPPPLHPPSPHPPPPAPPPPFPPPPPVPQLFLLCTLKYEGNTDWLFWGCYSDSATSSFTAIAAAVHPQQDTLGNRSMIGINGGCCLQVTLLDTTKDTKIGDPALDFTKTLPTGSILAWALANKICGPSATLFVMVGWGLPSPTFFALYGCNPGAAGVMLPQMCRCV